MMSQISRRIAVGLVGLVVLASDNAWSGELNVERRGASVDELLERIAVNTQVIRQQNAALRQRLGEDRGIAASENFSVLCSSLELDSRKVLAEAESWRQRIATEWLGTDLPEGAEFTLIHVHLSRDADEGLTLLVDRPQQGRHRIWLTTSKQRALGSTLAHEVAHVVLRARFPKGMPAWANEGVASLYDDAERKQRRREILKSFIESGEWPPVSRILDAPRMNPSDEQAYALAVSLTQFLLSRGGRREFLSFVQLGMSAGWNEAFNRVYSIATPEDLQQLWSAWVGRALLQPTVADVSTWEIVTKAS